MDTRSPRSGCASCRLEVGSLFSCGFRGCKSPVCSGPKARVCPPGEPLSLREDIFTNCVSKESFNSDGALSFCLSVAVLGCNLPCLASGRLQLSRVIRVTMFFFFG